MIIIHAFMSKKISMTCFFINVVTKRTICYITLKYLLLFDALNKRKYSPLARISYKFIPYRSLLKVYIAIFYKFSKKNSEGITIFYLSTIDY